jgi:uncharacterized protein (TIGR02996 family)
MTDRAALLAAICAHPDDDTPRLVYADWLDEHGQGKRAALIREQIGYHRLSTADTAAAAVDAFLGGGYEGYADRIDWAVADADLGACAAARRADRRITITPRREGLPSFRFGFYTDPVRGFYGGVVVEDVSAFLARADEFFRAAPITTLIVTYMTEEDATALAASGYLARVRELHFDTLIEPAAIRVLGNHPDAAGVRRLELTEAVGPVADALDALAAGKFWTGVEVLRASDLFDLDEPPEDRQLADLLARPQFRNLREIDAPASQVGDRAVRAMATHLPELRVLRLNNNPISGRGLAALAGSKTLPHLRYLDLDSCEAEAADPAPLAAAANLPNLAVLLLGACALSGPNPKVLARPGRGPGLRVLDLSASALSAAGVEALAACPAVRGVWHLNLSDAGVGDEHLERFIRRAAFDRLTYLDLSHNELTSRGAKVLAEWPGAAALQWLSLVANGIGDAGAKALAASPYLRGLRSLSYNGRGTARLRKRFRKAFV